MHEVEVERESPEVEEKLVLALVVGFIIFVGISLVALRAYYQHVEKGVALAPPRAFPAPQLETRNAQDLTELAAAQKGRLQGYGWVDRDKGIIRIPIARAMELIAARGAAALDPLEQPAQPVKPAP